MRECLSKKPTKRWKIILTTIFKLIIGLISLLVVIRLLGKKEMSNLTPFDFVYALVLGGLLEESLYDEKISFLMMMMAIGIWGLLIYLIEVVVTKNDWVRALLKGKPSVIIKSGNIDLRALKKNHLELEQLQTMLRQKGIFKLKEVRDLYLEPNGAISVNLYPEAEPPTAAMLNLKVNDDAPGVLLVDEGVIEEDLLKFAGKTRDWLLQELTKQGYPKLEDIFYAEWSSTDGFHIKSYQDLD